MEWISSLNWVDWVFVAVLLYGATMGAIRGLSHELGILISLLAALIVTRIGYEPLADKLCTYWNGDLFLMRLLAVVALILATLLAMWLLRKALGSMMDFHFKGLVEHLGGLVTGLLRRGAVFLVILTAAYFVQVNWLQRAIRYDSMVGRVMLPYLTDKYNELAEKAQLLQAEIPTGIQLVMPPLPEQDEYMPPPETGD